MNIESILESILFISGEPMSFKKLEKIIEKNKDEVITGAETLAKKYSESNGGLKIIIKDNKIQMVTAGENSQFVEKFFKADIEGDLSRAALEVLSVVAYRGPIARTAIEEIRGVNCSFTLRHLMIRDLVERISNPNDSRAYLYKISFDFLKKLGIEKVEDLPKFIELKEKELPKEIKETDDIVEKKRDEKKSEIKDESKNL
ncbi:MAG: SMC-Scp complex subunit ScpB [Candidatus Pacebacteria bacterium]|nr:SMC-Scp complex subunit ScpB [Candidatus Paceibacterota bacterium]